MTASSPRPAFCSRPKDLHLIVVIPSEVERDLLLFHIGKVVLNRFALLQS